MSELFIEFLEIEGALCVFGSVFFRTENAENSIQGLVHIRSTMRRAEKNDS